MSKVAVVIGANYGDEGKGHAVDHLSSPDSIVVRFNGGAQAGHTVVTPDGRRHVFHHLGSGTFSGASTFLSKYFICNPLLFRLEMQDLTAKDAIDPIVYVDHDAMVTTPWDMMLNQAVERKRGDARHGSCGAGINETVVREEYGFRLRYSQLFEDNLEELLIQIQEVYVPVRARELGVSLDDMQKELWPNITKKWIEDTKYFLGRTVLCSWSDLNKDNLVFEGAQGLALDQHSPDFPYVTRSNTGITNVVQMLIEADISDRVNVYYVTRPYITRHGRGPLSHEVPREALGNPRIEDKTNVPNPHQETLRWAFFDVGEFLNRISRDVYQRPVNMIPHVMMTCADQVDRIKWYSNGMEEEGTPAELMKRIANGSTELRADKIFSGPTRND